MNKRGIASIVIYVFAGLLAAYTLWSLFNSAGVISEAVNAGQITIWGNLYDVIAFYMANCAQYFVYALLLFASGMLLRTKQPEIGSPVASMIPEKMDEDDEDADSWFEETDEDKK